MEENTWELDEPFLYHLFDDAYLVDEFGASPAAPESPSPTSSVTIVVSSTGFTPKDREFLSKIMAAVSTELKACNIIAHSNESPVSLLDLTIPNNSKTILFGLQPDSNQPFYNLTPYLGGFTLFADDLPVLRENQDKKRLLWEALKQLFK